MSQSGDYSLVGAVTSEVAEHGDTGPGTVPREAAKQRLSRLSEREREVYESVDLEGLRPAELARYIEPSESAIRTYLSRARQKVGESEQ